MLRVTNESNQAELEISKCIKKPRDLADILVWTLISKPAFRITQISGKVCEKWGKDLFFAFESNYIFSIFLL